MTMKLSLFAAALLACAGISEVHLYAKEIHLGISNQLMLYLMEDVYRL
jgi:hypothetical protein